jgi:hypothetical protein
MLVLVMMANVTIKNDMKQLHFVVINSFNMSEVEFPAELTEESQDKGSTAAEFSLLHAPYLRQNWLKWVPIYDTVQKGKGLKIIHPFLVDKSNWMDIMLVWHLMVEHPFSAAFGKHGKAWKTFVVNLSKVEDPDGKVVFGVQGIGEKVEKNALKS